MEGFKKHNHTLKAGKHLFPFELRLGGALPSSLATYVNGGASISYKLRATAVRPGLSANLTTVLPITLLRSFAPEALEYQQTLEIENTWPDKIMYALMIPHKAWAAGDELSVLLKFAPLQKGVRVLSVTTQLCETIKTLARGGYLEKSRNIVTRKHEIVDGKAIEEMQLRKMIQNKFNHETGQSHSGSSSPGYPAGGAHSGFVSGATTPIHGATGLSMSGSASGSMSGESSSSSAPGQPATVDEDGTFDSEVTTVIKVNLPATLTPSHALDPIVVSYRVRWSVLLANLDGHTSELRCSLPIHILDFSLLEEARASTRVTRRLLFGWEEDRAREEEDDVVLPSYPSHVRDRIAVTVDMADGSTSPGAAHISGATTPLEIPSAPTSGELQSPPSGNATGGSLSGPSSFITSTLPSLQLGRRRSNSSADDNSPPQNPSSSTESSRPVSRHGRTESLDAQSAAATNNLGRGNDRQTASSGGWRSLMMSRAGSRANSRAPSPERYSHAHSQSLPHAIQPAEPTTPEEAQVHVHASNAASRQPHGLFSVVMKPIPTSMSMSLPWHSSSHSNALASYYAHAHSYQHPNSSNTFASVNGGLSGNGSRTNSMGDLRGMVMPSGTPLYGYGYGVGSLQTPGGGLYSHAICPTPAIDGSSSTSAVPDYFTASHGSGAAIPIPPLESLRDLPTYEDSEAQAHQSLGTRPSPREEDVQRSFSDSNLVGRLASTNARATPPVR